MRLDLGAVGHVERARADVVDGGVVVVAGRSRRLRAEDRENRRFRRRGGRREGGRVGRGVGERRAERLVGRRQFERGEFGRARRRQRRPIVDARNLSLGRQRRIERGGRRRDGGRRRFERADDRAERAAGAERRVGRGGRRIREEPNQRAVGVGVAAAKRRRGRGRGRGRGEFDQPAERIGDGAGVRRSGRTLDCGAGDDNRHSAGGDGGDTNQMPKPQTAAKATPPVKIGNRSARRSRPRNKGASNRYGVIVVMPSASSRPPYADSVGEMFTPD